MSIKVSCKNTHRRWRHAIAEAQTDVLVFSPYVTSRTADWVVAVRPKLTIYTCFRIKAFASGASSLQTLARLLRGGARIFHLHDLHAKVITDRSTFLFVGSQNLTRRGTHNREVTLWTDDSATLGEIDRILRDWIVERVPVTEEMIADAQQLIKPLRKMAWTLEVAAQQTQKEVEAAERERQERRRKEAQETREAHEKREVERYRDNMLRRLDALGDGIAPLPLAVRIIRAAIWWTSHSSGKPVRARGHAQRISEYDPARRLELGSNYLAVGKFVQKAKASMWRWFDGLDEWGWFTFHHDGEERPANGSWYPSLVSRLARRPHGEAIAKQTLRPPEGVALSVLIASLMGRLQRNPMV